MKCGYCKLEIKRGLFCSRDHANKGNAKKNSVSKTGKNNPMFGKIPHNYKGGSFNLKSGSRNVVYKTVFSGGKQVPEHRVIMERFIGRKLTKDEVVHHIDGNGLNNSLSNLTIMLKSNHSKLHFSKLLKNEKGQLLSSRHK